MSKTYKINKDNLHKFYKDFNNKVYKLKKEHMPYLENEIIIVVPNNKHFIENSPIEFIMIPPYVFSIHKFYYVNERLHVVILSHNYKTNIFKIFEYYCSNSDLNFFRLCITTNNKRMYYKGYNYVSGTFINIHLQRFLNDNIKYYNTSIGKINDLPCEDINDIKDIELKNRIQNNDSISQNQIFLILNELFPHVETINDYKNILKQVYDKLLNGLNKSDAKLYLEIYDLMKKYDVDKYIGNESRTEFFIRLKNTINEFILNHFELVSNSEKYLFYKQATIGTINIDMKVCSANLISKDTKKIYNIIYILYLMDNEIYKNIIHIYPSDAYVLMSGLDSKYVSAGILINKPFDYKSQAPITFTNDGDRGKIEENSNYIFIGKFTNYEWLPNPKIMT